MTLLKTWPLFLLLSLFSCNLGNLTCPYNRGNCSVENKNIKLDKALVKRDVGILEIFLEKALGQIIHISESQIDNQFGDQDKISQDAALLFFKGILGKDQESEIYFYNSDQIEKNRNSLRINRKSYQQNRYTRFLQDNFRNSATGKYSFDMYPLRTVENMSSDIRTDFPRPKDNCLLILPESRIFVLF